VAVLVGVTACVLLTTHRSQARSLSLVFERYGSAMDFDYSVQDVAFLWFTNLSGQSYCLPMMGGTVRLKLLFSQPAVLRVWSDRELSPPGERLTK
jgi:hypothetical protein